MTELNDDSRSSGPHRSVLPAVVLATLVVLSVGCAGEPAWNAGDATAIYERYQDVDLDYFFDAPPDNPTPEHPLYRGLKAKIDGRLDDAERHLEAATGAVPDSLRPFVYERLRELNRRVSDWEDMVRYRARTDSTFTAGSELGQVIAQRPVPDVEMNSDTVTVPLDRLWVEGHINGIDRSIPVMLDTGAPGMGVNLPQPFVERYDLPVDTTVAVGRSVVPSLGINAPKYQAHIDSISIGGVTIRNVHATVTGSGDSDDGEQGSVSGDAELGEASLEAGLLRSLFDEIRYNYADSTFTMIREVPEQEVSPNFAVMSDGWPIVRAEAGGRSMTGVVDTGSGNTWLYKSHFSPDDYELVRTRSGTTSSGYEWSVDIYRVPLTFPGGLTRNELAIDSPLGGGRSYRMEAIFGQDLWLDGTLVLDYQNRRVRYESAYAENVDSPDRASGSQ